MRCRRRDLACGASAGTAAMLCSSSRPGFEVLAYDLQYMRRDPSRTPRSPPSIPGSISKIEVGAEGASDEVLADTTETDGKFPDRCRELVDYILEEDVESQVRAGALKLSDFTDEVRAKSVPSIFPEKNDAIDKSLLHTFYKPDDHQQSAEVGVEFRAPKPLDADAVWPPVPQMSSVASTGLRQSAKSCAVVSSNAALVGQKLGGVIDRNDQVLRINRAPAGGDLDMKKPWQTGLPEDVGNRTTLRFHTPRSAPMESGKSGDAGDHLDMMSGRIPIFWYLSSGALNNGKELQQLHELEANWAAKLETATSTSSHNAASALALPETETDESREVGAGAAARKQKDEAHKDKIKPKDRGLLHWFMMNSRILDTRLIQVLKIFDPKDESGINSRVTTGSLAVFLGMLLCDEVRLYGMTPSGKDQDDSMHSHYWDKPGTFVPNQHQSARAEHRMWQALGKGTEKKLEVVVPGFAKLRRMGSKKVCAEGGGRLHPLPPNSTTTTWTPEPTTATMPAPDSTVAPVSTTKQGEEKPTFLDILQHLGGRQGL